MAAMSGIIPDDYLYGYKCPNCHSDLLPNCSSDCYWVLCVNCDFEKDFIREACESGIHCDCCDEYHN